MLNFLASYPKSGNTWVRVLIDAYIRDKEPDINDLIGTYADGHVSLYRIAKGVDIKDLPYEHQILARPMALLRLSELGEKVELDVDIKVPVIVKTHMANATIQTIRFIPPSITNKVLYIVRNPLSVVSSYARHFDKTIDGAVDSLLDSTFSLYDPKDNKVPQYTGSWMQHVWTYAGADDLDVSILRYEDLRTEPLKHFKWILKWFGIEYNEERAKRAIVNSELSKLRKQEEDKGFKEKSPNADKFFGQGSTTDWQNQLTEEQIERIVNGCRRMMLEFKYLDDLEKVA